MTSGVTSVRTLPQRGPAPAPLCAHCGQPVPVAMLRVQEGEQFCCAGCRQVCTLVREWGFDQYYRLVHQQQSALEPARVSGRSFDDFDDEPGEMSWGQPVLHRWWQKVGRLPINFNKAWLHGVSNIELNSLILRANYTKTARKTPAKDCCLTQ